MEQTGSQFALAALANWNATYVATVPAPPDCSELYAAGWKYGDWWMSRGGTKANTMNTFETQDNWSEERANGFWDRLNHED